MSVEESSGAPARLNNAVSDIGFVQVHRHAFTAYMLITVLFNLGIVVGCQCIAIYWWDQEDAPTLLEAADVPGQAMHTDYPWYAPHATSPTGILSDQGFLRYSTLLLWAVVVVTGLGSEIIVGEPIIKAMGDSKVIMQAWMFSQLLFSLFISVALMSQSPFGYPFAVMGFWKMGFPETFAYFRRAFRVGKLNFEAVAAYLNGVGTLIHHSTGAYLVVACSTHLMPLDRRTLSVSLPLVAQHLFVLLRYVNMPVYALCELCLEIGWEWEVFSNVTAMSVANGYDISSRGTAITMVVAHWFYWSAALCCLPKMLGLGGEAGTIATLSKIEEPMDFETFFKVLQDKNPSINKEQAKSLFDLSDEDQTGVIDQHDINKLISSMMVLFPELDAEQEARSPILEVYPRVRVFMTPHEHV